MNYLALDVATTTGLAWSDKENNIYTKYHKGTPLELFEVAKLVVTSYEIDLVLIEKLNYFSFKTKKGSGSIPISSLLKRIGYIEFKFEEIGLNYEELNIVSCRKQIGFEKKNNHKKIVYQYFNDIDSNITSDCADALTMLYTKFSNWRELKINYVGGTN